MRQDSLSFKADHRSFDSAAHVEVDADFESFKVMCWCAILLQPLRRQMRLGQTLPGVVFLFGGRKRGICVKRFRTELSGIDTQLIPQRRYLRPRLQLHSCIPLQLASVSAAQAHCTRCTVRKGNLAYFFWTSRASADHAGVSSDW